MIVVLGAAIAIGLCVRGCQSQANGAPLKLAVPVVVVFSPDYFECGPCKQAVAWLEQSGVDVIWLDVSEASAGTLGIKAFPHIVAGNERVEGFGAEQQRRLKQLIRRN